MLHAFNKVRSVIVKLILKKIFFVSVLLFTAIAHAEDIDLFVTNTSSTNTELPNVLIILDNTANWSSAFANEMNALQVVMSGLAQDKFNVGLMMFTETGSGNSGNDGGYIRAAIRRMNATNKALYSAVFTGGTIGSQSISALGVNADKSNGGKLGLTMADAYRYFNSGAPYSGNNKVKTDYQGNTLSNNIISALSTSGWALSSKTSTPYIGPTQTGCTKNYIIYISNGAVQDNNSDTSTATSLLSTEATAANISNATVAIPISPSGSQDNVGDEWARFMKLSSLGITTYTIDINKVTTGQGPGWTALLKSMASVSNGKYFDVASSGTQISDALNRIFSEIQDVNSVYASVSLPVSVSTQDTFLNQVYIGLFRPDPDAYPRWAGNLKQYKLGNVNNALVLQDADSNSAIGNKGFIGPCARSFWTPSTVDTYWAFKPQGTCSAIANSYSSNYPDGNIVEKGGEAYKLRATTTRTMKTCSTTFASCTSLLDFNSTNVSQTDLGAGSTAERDALINWQKGLDVDDENINGVTTTEMRPSAHGDVVHSRPVAINFGTDTAPQVVVFYGGNDGVFRAINGNRAAAIGTIPAGGELWSFVPPEFFSKIKRLRDNSPAIKFYGSTISSAQLKDYGMDGVVTGYQSGSTAYVYATMRRGGRALYAFDVSTATTPLTASSITLKWKKGCPNLTNDTNCTTGFTDIGQTWSAPKILKSSGYGSGASPMIIFGGGYDNCEDSDPHTCTATSKGKKIYVLDANTGATLKTFDTDRSVVGDVFVVNDTSTGLATYAYATDTGGNIYRITINGAAPASWTSVKIASLGCSTVATCSAPRKFLYGVDIVNDNGTLELTVGSGDREKPVSGFTSAASTSNYFFLIKDKPSDTDWLSTETANCSGSSVICLNSLVPIAYGSTTPPDASTLATKKGWYLGLAPTEQVVTSSLTVFNNITFSTSQPAVYSAGQCSGNLGTATVYNISRLNASNSDRTTTVRGQVIVGGGLPPSPVAGQVKLDDGTTAPFIIGASPTSALEGGSPATSTTTIQPKSRVYWYIQQ